MSTSLFERIVKRISEVFHWIGAVILALIFIMVVLDVITRTAGVRFIPDVGELSGLAVVLLTFLAVPLCLRQGRQIRVDLVTGKVSPKARYIMRIASDAVIIGFCLFMVWWGARMVFDSYTIGFATGVWRIPIWTIQIVVPLGLLFFALEAAFEVVSLVKSGVPAKALAEGVESK